jgi:hypothetical protein
MDRSGLYHLPVRAATPLPQQMDTGLAVLLEEWHRTPMHVMALYYRSKGTRVIPVYRAYSRGVAVYEGVNPLPPRYLYTHIPVLPAHLVYLVIHPLSGVHGYLSYCPPLLSLVWAWE